MSENSQKGMLIRQLDLKNNFFGGPVSLEGHIGELSVNGNVLTGRSGTSPMYVESADSLVATGNTINEQLEPKNQPPEPKRRRSSVGWLPGFRLPGT